MTMNAFDAMSSSLSLSPSLSGGSGGSGGAHRQRAALLHRPSPPAAPTVPTVAPSRQSLERLTDRVSDTERSAIMAVLPGRARELVDAIGFLPTIRMLLEVGGERVVIPVVVPSSDDSVLVSKLGRETVEKLVSACPGDRFDMPRVTSIERLLRDNAIRADFDGGASMRTLVRRYQMTDRHLRKLLGSRPQTSPQPARRPPAHGDAYTRDLFAAAHEHEPAPEPGATTA